MPQIGIVSIEYGTKEALRALVRAIPSHVGSNHTKNTLNDNQIRLVDAFDRIRVFGNLYPGDFPVGSKAAELLEIIKAAVTDAREGGAIQSSSGGASRAGTQTKADFYEELYQDMRAINRTAKAIATEMPGLSEKFRMPRSPSYGSVLIAARAFLADATPLAAKFIEYEMPADFLEDLAADIEVFDSADDDQDAGMTTKVGATRSIAEAVMAGAAGRRNLDPLIRNKYRNQPVKLREWFSASHVERSPKRAKSAVERG